MTRDPVDADDVIAAVNVVATMLDSPAAADDARWDERAGALDWSCRQTLAHTADCAVWYAANLARKSTTIAEVGVLSRTERAPVLVDALRSGGALLAAAVKVADAADRGCHPFGMADRSGFAAMGCDEVLVHGADLATALGVAYEPPPEVCERVVRRLFPWAPTDTEPWPTLLWANGRIPLGDRPPESQWLWQCAPLAEWDGRPRRVRAR